MGQEAMQLSFLFSVQLIFCCLLVFSFAGISLAFPTTPCGSTANPDLCRSILSGFPNPIADQHHQPMDCARFSLEYSLKQAQNLSEVLRGYYLKKKGSPCMKLGRNPIKSDFEPMEVHALENCSDLAALNVDYIKSILVELKNLTGSDYERVESLLGDLMSNQDTCYEQIVKSFSGTNKSGENNDTIRNTIRVLISDVTGVYGISQGLVFRALGNSNRVKEVSLSEVDNNGDQFLSKKQQEVGSMNRFPLDAFIQYQRMIHNSEVQSNGILIYDVISVGQSPHDNFRSISKAIDSAPSNLKPNDGYFAIYVRQGVYHEYVSIPQDKTNIMILGDGIGRTVITGNRNSIDGWNTYDSATFSVLGDGFVAIDVTFRNTAGPSKFQAVAVMNRADLSTFYRCSFEGYQDTLYAHSKVQFYRECVIYGTVDFIFGDAAAVFQNCDIYTRKPLLGQFNTITAQGRQDSASKTGFSLHNCRIDAAPDLAEDLNYASSFLGRPWQKYARVVVMESYIGKAIDRKGWSEWDGNFGLNTLFYGEYRNYGPGADTTRRVRWRGFKLMDSTQAAEFTVHNFTNGGAWLSNVDVPFSQGLLR